MHVFVRHLSVFRAGQRRSSEKNDVLYIYAFMIHITAITSNEDFYLFRLKKK